MEVLKLIGLFALMREFELKVNGIFIHQHEFHRCSEDPHSIPLSTESGQMNPSLIDYSLSCGIKCNLYTTCQGFFICLSAFPAYCYLDITDEEENLTGPCYCFRKIPPNPPTDLHLQDSVSIGSLSFEESITGHNPKDILLPMASIFNTTDGDENATFQSTTKQAEIYTDFITSTYNTDAEYTTITSISTVSVAENDQTASTYMYKQTSEINVAIVNSGDTEGSKIEDDGDEDTDTDSDSDSDETENDD